MTISPSSSQDQLIKQYEILRDELVVADSQNYKVTAGVFTACSVILLTGFQQLDQIDTNLAKYWLCLAIFSVSFVVSVPGYRMLMGNRKRVWRIASYMEIFLEPLMEHMKWETRIQKLRGVESREINQLDPKSEGIFKKLFSNSIISSSDVITNELLLMAFFNCVAFVGVIMSFLGIEEWVDHEFGANLIDSTGLMSESEVKIWITLCFSLIFVALSYFKAKKDIKSESRIGATRARMVEYWKTVKTEEGGMT